MWRRVLLVALILGWLVSGQAIAAELSLQSISPQGPVERLTQIVVRFNAPMHALGDMSQDAATSPLLVSLSADYKTPPPPGSYRWLDDRTVAYLLDAPQLQALTLYCKVKAGSASLTGAVLAKDAAWIISTPNIEIIESRPEYQQALGNRGDIALVFNQPIDLDSLKQSASLTVNGKPVPLQIKEEPLPDWVNPTQQLSRTYLFTTANKLELGQKVVLNIKPGLRSAEGYTALAKGITCDYYSFHNLALEDFYINELQSAPGLFDPESDILLKFNNPLDGQRLKDKLKLEIKVKDNYKSIAVDTEQGENEYLYLYAALEPRQQYRLTIGAGLTDSYGGVLAQDKVVEIKTGDFTPLLHTAYGEAVIEGQFPASQTIWLRNIKNFSVTLDYYNKENVWKIYDWYCENYWADKATPPKADISKTHQITAPVTPNKPYAFELDIPALLGDKPMSNGVVLLTFSYKLPGADNSTIRRTLVQHNDLGLSLKYGFSNGLIWVTSLREGSPIAGAQLLLMDHKGKMLWQGVSDQQGIAVFPGVEELGASRTPNSTWGYPKLVLLARHGDQLAALSSFMQYNNLRYTADNYADQSLGLERSARLHVITQLPLYTPGATVNFLLYVRDLEDGVLKAKELKDVTVEVKDPTGKVVYKGQGDCNSFGSLAGSFILDSKARLGKYDVFLSWPDSKRAISQYEVFDVQYYRTPDYRVEVTPDSGQVKVAAEYFFGAPVGAAPVKLMLGQKAVEYTPAPLAGYVVGPNLFYAEDEIDEHDEAERGPAFLGSQQGVLDAQGRTVFNITPWKPASEKGRMLTRRLLIRAEVTSVSGQVVSGFSERYLHPGKYYVGIKAPYLSQAGTPFDVQLLACGADDKAAPALSVELSLLKRQWDMVRERGVDGFYQMVCKYTDTPVESRVVNLPAGGGRFSMQVAEAGEYIVQSKVTDQDGGVQVSNSFLYAYGAGLSPWQHFSDNSLELVLENNNITVGDKARIMVKNPFQQATALITVEREGVSRQWVEYFTSSAPVIEVPMGLVDAPNTYVSVFLVRGRNGQPPVSGPDLAKPQVRFGNVQIKVNESAKLKVEVTSAEKVYKPSEQVKVKVAVKGTAGLDAAPYQVTLLAVDERVLAVAGNRNNYDPTDSMLRMLALKVLSEDSRVNIIDQRFSSGLKGEETAGGGGLSPATLMRSKFNPDVYWLAQGVTDNQGQLTAAFDLPDSLTSYRIVAIAADKGNHFGVGSGNVQARKSMQLLSSLPAFVVMGDQLKARFIVQNMSDKAGRAALSLEVSGLELKSSANQELALAAGEMRSVDFICQVPVGVSEQAVFKLHGSLAEDSDDAQFTIPVLAASRGYAAVSSGIAKPGQAASVSIKPPDDAAPTMNKLNISLATTPASSLAWPISYLQDYRWECLEQKTSKAVGLAFTYKQGDMLGLVPQGNEAGRIKATLASWADFQDEHGQMYLWDNFSAYRDYFYPYLTAYTLMAGAAIKDMTGLAIDQQVETKAYNFLQGALKNPGKHTLSQQTEAMLIWLLAQRQPDKAASYKPALNSLLSRLKGQDPFTLACLLMAAHSMGDKALMDSMVVRLDKGKVVTGTHVHFSRVSDHSSRMAMGSDIRDNALVLLALTKAAPNYAALEGLALWLSEKIASSQWITTQDAAYTLLAMQAYLQKLNPQPGVKAQVTMADKTLISEVFAKVSDPPVNRVFNGIQPGVVAISSDNGPLYWTSRLNYTLMQPSAQAQNAGFSVSHKISLLDVRRQSSGQEVTQAELGQALQCTVTLIVPESRLHVLVFDPIPAGLEPLDATSINQPTDENSDWQWVEMRKDGLMLYAYDLPPGVYSYSYKLRASSPGEFIWRGAQAEEMYAPENFGQGAGGKFVVSAP